MSNGSLRRSSSSSVEPHTTISAQDLIGSKPDRYGFLRKRGRQERLLESVHLSRHVNWRQRYVVVKDGCCYCFRDELSKSPLQTFSFRGYNRIFRSQSERAYFVFCLEPASHSSLLKVHSFAASTETERLAWMQIFRSAMATANDVQPTTPRFNETKEEDEYVALEKPVYEVPEYSLGLSQARNGEGEEEEDEEEEGEYDSDYDMPDEQMVQRVQENIGRRNVPLPPVPQAQTRPKPPPPLDSGDCGTAGKSKPQDIRNRPSVPLPGMASPPDVMSKTKSLPARTPPVPKPPAPKNPTGRRLSEQDSLFDNSDREAAIEIIRKTHVPGTFLIRKSRQGDSKVLVVMTTDDVKEYKIFIENGQCSLDKKSFFISVDDLLNHYRTTCLPNRQQTLSRSFSSSSDR